MLEWYKNKKAEIYFSEYPRVRERYFIPSMQEKERKTVEKYPYINEKNLRVKLVDPIRDVEYEFNIPKGYCFDGASIPKVFWRVIGAKTDNRFLIPALVHDILCENHHFVNNDRKFSTEVFNALLEANRVCPMKRFLMKNSVDMFQKCFCSWRFEKTKWLNTNC